MKYESWIVVKREVVDDRSSFNLVDDKGRERRRINYTYACPYCHKEYCCSITNNLSFRKCRYCNHSVSPYQGEIVESAWMFDYEAEEFNKKEAGEQL